MTGGVRQNASTTTASESERGWRSASKVKTSEPRQAVGVGPHGK